MSAKQSYKKSQRGVGVPTHTTHICGRVQHDLLTENPVSGKKSPTESSLKEEIYRQCAPLILCRPREKTVPKKSNARLQEEHFNDWSRSNNHASHLLYNLALGGDENAANLLFQFAFTSTELLLRLAQQNPDVLRNQSEYQIQWPIIWSKKKYLMEQNQEVLKELKIGSKSRMTGKFNPKSPATVTALMLLQWVQNHREKLCLPDLTQKTRDKWFEEVWERYEYEFKGKPATDPVMRKLVLQASKNQEKKKQDKSNLETIIAGRIRDALKTGFESLTSQAS